MAFKTWGGKRKGAGRPPKAYRSSERHETRDKFDKLTVIHVTLRVVFGIGNLRTRDAYFAIRKATKAVLNRTDFRIVHMSLEKDHLHLIVEADNDGALTRGMQAFESSAAQYLNRLWAHAGKMFEDRYHERTIHSPTEARHCISYVLNNWRHHDRDVISVDVSRWDVDYFSSAVSFAGWKELADEPFLFHVPEDRRLCVSAPRSWLLRDGWRKAGSISKYDVPGR